ncbi:MAG: N-acetylmuramoyl-L-alanine amidase [Armatimonadota bacterium]|nr:N-acetylmuramoyl-L-alanine amidase [Armatimonadota bacterium]
MLGLVAALPGMVMPAFAAPLDTPVEASITYSYSTPALKPPALKIADECFLPIKMASKFGWSVTTVGEKATVKIDGRQVTTFVRAIGDTPYLPFRSVMASVGAVTEWTGPTSIRAMSRVFRIEAKGNRLEVRGTLPVMVTPFVVRGPDRVVLDIKGAIIDPTKPPEIEGDVRYAQFSKDTVRVVIQVDGPPKLRAGDRPSTLVTAVEWSGASVVALQPLGTEAVSLPDTTPKGVSLSVPANIAGVPNLVTDTPNLSVLQIPMRTAGPKNVTVRRQDGNLYLIRIPGARPESEFDPIQGAAIKTASYSVSGNDTILSLELKRPMGVSVEPANDRLTVTISQPRSAGGRLSDKTIVIDPGHGGSDIGARSGSLYEKNLTLPISKMVVEGLKDLGATVLMTRSSDATVGLNARPTVANDSDAHFFVSVHINSNTVANSQSGSFVYYHGGDGDAKLLADLISEEIGKVSELKSHGSRSDFTVAKTRGFAVLRGSKMPGVLVEVAYINNATDRKYLQTAAFQRKIADAIIRGIKAYIGE